MAGIEAGSGEGQATIHPAGWDPLVAQIQELSSQTALLQRIANSLEIAGGYRDIIIPLTPGKSDGTIVSGANHPRVRIRWIVISPVGTGEPVVMIGTEIIFHGSVQAIPVPYVIPYNRVIQEGVDIVLYDASAPSTAPAFLGYIIGTVE